MIIQNIGTIGTSIVEFLCISKRLWHVREQTGLKATSIDLVCIEESEEDETKEHHFVEAQPMLKDAKEENVVTKEE
jgi:hypothetical protein